jgi:hypothetical protein
MGNNEMQIDVSLPYSVSPNLLIVCELNSKVHVCLYTNQASQSSAWVKIMGHVVFVV